MEIILLEKVENLGGFGDKVKVRSGYARNYLIPTRKAVLATVNNVKDFDARRSELEARSNESLAKAQARKLQLEGYSLTIASKTADEGKLYGSVSTVDIANALQAAGHAVERKEVRLIDGPIRVLGQHPVNLHLHTEVNVTITVEVVGEA
jgi:large subunit ribosomal protein L9